MTDGRIERLIAEAGDLARSVNTCDVRVMSPNREVTAIVGPGGVPRRLEFSGAARGLGARVLARVTLDTLNAARDEARALLRSRFGDRAGNLWFAEKEVTEETEEPVVTDEVSGADGELERLRRLAADKLAAGRELRRGAAGAGTVVESPDGRIRVLVGVAGVREMSFEDDVVADELLGDRIIELIQAGMARSAQREAERSVEIKMLDVRTMVAAYAPKGGHRG